MNHILFAAQPFVGIVALAVVGFVFIIIIFLAIWASRYTKVGPNQVLVVSVRKHRIRDADGTALLRGFRAQDLIESAAR